MKVAVLLLRRDLRAGLRAAEEEERRELRHSEAVSRGQLLEQRFGCFLDVSDPNVVNRGVLSSHGYYYQ
jgi:hypothetical protein